MKRIGIWFFLSCKRHICRLSFVLILLLLPMGTFFIRKLQKHEDSGIRIAVCAETEKGGSRKNQEKSLEQELVLALSGRQAGDGLFEFYPCAGEQEVKDEVASKRAECGYVISAGLRERLDQKDLKRNIRVYQAPSTVAAKLSSETVFAAMIELYDRELFCQYMEKKMGDGAESAGDVYDKWKKNGSTFDFTYELIGSRGKAENMQSEPSVFPVRGIVAVYVFVIGLYGGAIGLADEKKGMFLKIPYGMRFFCCLAGQAAPVFLASLSGMASLWTGNCVRDWGYELAALAGYGGAVVLFSWILGRICRREETVCSLIPFFLVGSLIFCPVFLDIRRYVPEFGTVERFFLPGYYLRLFN